MNLRKTITGAAVALGGAAVMLGLGGTAHAAEIGAEARPQLDTEPGKIATIGDLTRIDTENLADGVHTANLDVTDPESTVESLAGSARDTLRGKAEELPTVETGVSLGA